MNASRFCRCSVLLACLRLIGPASAALAADAAQRPNFLFIYTDDQRWDALSVVQAEQGERARFPWFKTPHMDRLATEGIRFRNAFVVNSLCSPSRACFLTGRYNHVNGVANNHTPFPTDNVTYATLLRAAGYTTGYAGKFHMSRQRGQRPGFDYSASFIGQGRYLDCPFEINGASTPTEGWVDDRSTDFAIEFLKKNRKGPFALVVGFKACHGPFTPPDRAKDRFKGVKARPPASRDVPAIYRAQAAAQAKKQNANPGAANEARQAGVSVNYFRCISAADDNVGRLLAALDELDLAANTMVIFTSDNGYYLGEHGGLGDKRTAYDESLRIPLLVRFPKLGVKGKAIDEMALNLDLAPTLLDFAGVKVPPEMQGRSWRPLLEGKPVDWRKAWLYEYFLERNYARIPAVLAMRTDDAKLIRYPGHEDWTEVFDLKADPYETRNLAKEPAHQELRRRLEAEFERQKKAAGFRVPPYADKTE